MDSHQAREVDVLIVGSGAAGLAAAAVAAHYGLSTVIVEKTDQIGGTTSYSGGTVWIPNSIFSHKANITDTIDLARKYFDKSLQQNGPRGPESTPDRIETYLREGPRMLELLQQLGFKWAEKPSRFPDYHPEVDGALATSGRTIDPAAFDAGELGSWNQHVRRPGHSAPAKYFDDFRILTKPYASVRDFLAVFWMALKARFMSVLKTSPVYMGCSLVAQLLAIHLRHRTSDSSIYLNAGLKDLVVENGQVCGGNLHPASGAPSRILARYGVILAAGGFARNQQLRDMHLPLTQTRWTLTQPGGDQGDALRAGQTVGAATALMGEAWWIPTMVDPVSAQTVPAMFEIAKPHCIIVDKGGSRFFSEAEPYGDGGRSLYNHLINESSSAWMILDSNYQRRYTLGSLLPGEQLSKTIVKWNEMCKTGVDTDFGKGQDEYQAFVGDSSAKHPNIGSIAQPPFYAISIQPGDAGSKGGLLTDEYSRVLRQDGSVIPGLYAAGNSTASIMGATSLGAGITIGPAMTFAYVAVQDIYSKKERGTTGSSLH
ncbi:fumarate reductase/succinate dehydrogenase flavoprotein [Thozetella sp. PMI_491]|nr:fumarate reductase/succinate dehydrogenase flavoprotein [Thozetella sp. PMI_491]